MANLTIEEYAVGKRVSGGTVMRWIRTGRLVAEKAGKRVLIPADARLDEPKKK